MGATDFMHIATGATVASAFDAAQTAARYDHGHSGYTGTIAEKSGWVIVSGELPRSRDEAMKIANDMMEDEDSEVNDKWGPAGAIPIVGGEWLFFGWASC